ncbi:3-oxoacyl-ACP reductase FabG [Candidatus Aerophobetes bacterium]|uniref:3-oxoacyl-ACP reductase FabG n=1 Tax=Aerophobetes bacterium TaxID=2030807 RepID=A0A523QM25_UNCAE|nr:MAG: 3-oxoacyl-ACP reductase FabG [Candidatus Aerophobetes bacterium]
MKLKDKIAIVTGASQGIGRGIALGFAEAGADVVVNCDRNIDGAETVANEIRTLGRRAEAIQGDVSRSNDVDRMVQETLRTFSRIDILVNNAGIYVAGPIENLREEDWDRVMEVNLKGVFLCCQAVGRHMIERKSGGSIINVASISGHMPELNSGAYTPSKAGVIGLTRLLAVEWAKYGIRVNALSPGPVMTPLQREAYPSEKLLEARTRAIPMNRHGTPEEMARVAIFLASGDSSYITGEDINVDGGSQLSMFYLVHRLAEST